MEREEGVKSDGKRKLLKFSDISCRTSQSISEKNTRELQCEIRVDRITERRCLGRRGLRHKRRLKLNYISEDEMLKARKNGVC